MNQENSAKNYSEQEQSLNIQELLLRYLNYWPWFVGSVVACVAVAFLYLKMTTPVYNVSAAIMIKDDKKGGSMASEMAAFQDLGLFAQSTNFDNELEVLKSKSLIKQVILEMNAYSSYNVRQGLRTVELYKESPLLVEMTPQENDLLHTDIEMEVVLQADSSIQVTGTYDEQSFQQELKKLPGYIHTPAGRVTFAYRHDVPALAHNEITVVVSPAMAVTKRVLGNLSIAPTSKTTSVASLSFKCHNRKKGEDFLAKLVEMYNRDTNNDKNVVGVKTEQFINDRIAIISGELGSTEQELESYKRRSGLTDPKQDAQVYLQENSQYEQKRIENATQINLITYLQEYVQNPANKESVIPANVGLQDMSLATLINSYNDQVLERDRLLRTSSPNNPVIQNLNTSIKAQHANVINSIASVRNGLLIAKQDIERQAGKYNVRIEQAPEQERILTNISRQQEIKSGLYLMLLQKREENSITMAATADNAKIIDAPLADNIPVSPKSSLILLIGLILGVVIPAGVIYVMDLLQFKIGTRHDVEKLTTMPILGEIPLQAETDGNRTIVVRENENNMMAETFRSLRTNLQFMLSSEDHKVILFTSTSPGEGKTFTSVNLAVSLALLGKKVVLLGLDIRKPRLAEHFGFSHKLEGITKFLSGGTNDIFSLLIDSGVTENLKVLPAGMVPPNPAELLASPRLEKAIDALKEKFDYVLLDTAPVALVTDTLIAGRVADLSVYVCRSEVTHKSDFELVNEIRKERKLPHMALVVNAVNLESKRYGYGYGYGKYGKYGRYGKKYGYGYGETQK
ncbi:GumC family protein [Bacteroides graminisolvens]|uniref:non-specific protein-tyrosine kinase n=1 Tax=Bacteroides graminisolvens DSM 19988 = JCM 15093 TaxID=1121097 RepID=A0A069D1A5_9BACE|nr:polysaccharide biosynthesis tyrosine autokinase [Bacteroides graminisolvens]GAK36120.1 tyrosine-protein kinase Wzc [Bacteroides graminisolvens DSM 19988 = JCM 15093]